MKKTGLLCLLAFGLMAQQKEIKKTSEMRIRVEKEENGKKQITEKVIDTSKMNDAEREKLMTKIQDSLSTNGKGKHLKVTINSEVSDMKSLDISPKLEGGEHQRIVIKRFSEKNKPMSALEKEIQVSVDAEDMDNPHIVMKDLGNSKSFVWTGNEDENDPMGVQGIRAYPNNPNNEMLNIRFNVPEKGDIKISVLDTNSNVLAKEEIKDFSGEYVGQLKIGKHTGTLFVMVIQNGDGNVKRIVIE